MTTTTRTRTPAPRPSGELPPPFGTVWLLGPFGAPHRPESMNGRRDRRALAGEVRDWRTMSFVRAQVARMPRGLTCRVRIDVTFRFADDPRRPVPGRDTANLQPAAKALVDGLTPARPLRKTVEAYGRRVKVQTGATIGYGFVIDDRPAHVDGPHLHIGTPLDWTLFGPTCDVTMRVEVIPPACLHTPRCPAADSRVPEAARAVAYHPEQGWTLLCNGVKLFDDGGVLIPSGPVPALPANRGPALHRAVVAR